MTRDIIADLATEFEIDVSADVLDAIVAGEDDLREGVESLLSPTERREPIGSRADDDYAALLDVYDSPRSEVEDGPLAGVSFAVKDNIAVEGLRMTCGISDRSSVPSFDATVVRRLLAEGASVVGKANMDLLAFGPTGEYSGFESPTNPVAEERIPGGSSSGSAVAVAAGLTDVALGTDTGGSVRIPASCCGIVGLKPTNRLVSRHGVVPLAPSADAIGPLTRNVKTAARILEAMNGYDPNDATSSRIDSNPMTATRDDPGNLTIGVLESFLNASSEAVVDEVERLIAELTNKSGVSVQRVSLDLTDVVSAYALTVAVEFAWLVKQDGVVRGDGIWYSEEWREALATFIGGTFTDHVVERVFPAAVLDEQLDGRAYTAARERRHRLRKDVTRLFADVDLLLTPTLRTLPPKIDGAADSESTVSIIGNTAPFNLTGHPAVTVPAGAVDGVPVGVQVVAEHYLDDRALEGASRIEKICRSRTGS